MATVISGCRVLILALISMNFYLIYGNSALQAEKTLWTQNEGVIATTINYIIENETSNESITNSYIPNIQNTSCTSYENGYCIDSIDYPMDHIQEKLSPDCHFYRNFFTRSKFKQKLGTPVLRTSSASPQPTSTRILPTSVSTVESEPVFFPHEEPLCRSHKRLKFMRIGRNVEKDWRFIVNQENFTQAVKTEECIGAGQSCAMAESLPLGYTTECKQEYSSRILLAVHPNGEILPDLFPLPSCCKCFLRRSMTF